MVLNQFIMTAIKFKEGFTKFMVSIALFKMFSCKDSIVINMRRYPSESNSLAWVFTLCPEAAIPFTQACMSENLGTLQ